ncbi:TVP38/TMEM64 family protein [Novispirillum sp. DQ9]|uniref:TVP38/TMEM64 family protein n=1 Tax=Novispirillum sp. DQ9 TaxID=3398612 RepID=UPI003C79BE42
MTDPRSPADTAPEPPPDLTEDGDDRDAMTGDTVADAAPGGLGTKALVKGLVMIVSLAAIGFGLNALGLADALDTHWLDDEVVGRGLHGMALFIGLGAVLAAIGVPRQLVAFGGGYAFGLWEGTLIALVAVTAGCVLGFFYARLLGRSLVKHRFGRRIGRIDAFLRDNPFTMTLLIRFLPVGSNVVTNLAAGVSSVSALPFIAGSAAGYVPQTVIFALLGTGVQVDPVFRITLSAALFIASAVLGVALYRRVRGARRAVSDT